jgi:DNA-binding NarL/FixJ family response regulator
MGSFMIDIVVGGTRNLFVDLLITGLRARGLRAELADPEPTALSQSVARSRPSLVLIDHRAIGRAEMIRLVAGAVNAGGGRTRVIVLSGMSDDTTVRAIRSAGASGLVHTSTSIDGLLRALDRVSSGKTVVCVPRSRRQSSSTDTTRPRRGSDLTPRERQCLGLLVDGVSTSEMASALVISELTVRSHIQRLLQKLGAHSRLEAASLAVKYRILEGMGPQGAHVS